MFMNELQELINRSDRIVINFNGKIIDRYQKNNFLSSEREWERVSSQEYFDAGRMAAWLDLLLGDSELGFTFFAINWQAESFDTIHTIKPRFKKACI